MLELYRETKQMKNGWRVRTVTLLLAVHSYVP